MAAGYLGAGNRVDVENALIASLRFRRGKSVPWKGALFLPRLQWKRAEARRLSDNLIRWMLWADIHNRHDIHQQIHNNLRGGGFARIVGFRSPGWRRASVVDWLVIWGKATSVRNIRSILRQQRVRWKTPYKQALSRI